MPMGVKDYNAIANMLKKLQQGAITHRERTLISRLIDELAFYCKSRNGNFDALRFREAAGYIRED